FVSLGLSSPAAPNGGEIVLLFHPPAQPCDGPGADLRIVESTPVGSPVEYVNVFVSTDNVTYTQIPGGPFPASGPPGGGIADELTVDFAGAVPANTPFPYVKVQ